MGDRGRYPNLPQCSTCGKVAVPEGLGTALKPATEFVTLARKPLIGTVAANVLERGTGALNIDGCRIGTSRPPTTAKDFAAWRKREGRDDSQEAKPDTDTDKGRWPANVILDPEAARLLDEQSGECASKGGGGAPASGFWGNAGKGRAIPRDDSGGASRFFYVAKPASAERHVGGEVENTHATVKPIELMEYLIRLVTPPGGIVLDPFMGSGTTGIAALNGGWRFCGIELLPDHFAIAERRIAAATAQGNLFHMHGAA
jgi:hypothetical protein